MLVNNAGIGVGGNIETCDFDDWKRCFAINVDSIFHGCQKALPLMRDWLHDTFFVLNGDTLFDAPLPRLAELLMSTGASGAVALRAVEDSSRYGSVILQDDRIASFGEKAASGPGLINGGLYAFRRRVIDRLGSPSSIETELLPALAEEGDLVGLHSDGFFIDIGLPETLADAQRSVPAWWSSRAASGAAGAT